MSYLIGAESPVDAAVESNLSDSMMEALRDAGLVEEATPAADDASDSSASEPAAAGVASEAEGTPDGAVPADGASDAGEDGGAGPAPSAPSSSAPSAPSAPTPDALTPPDPATLDPATSEPKYALVDDEAAGLTPGASSSTSSPDASSPSDDLDLNDLFTRYNGGQKPTVEQVGGLLRLAGDVGSLPLDEQQALAQYLQQRTAEIQNPLLAPPRPVPQQQAGSAQSPTPPSAAGSAPNPNLDPDALLASVPEEARELLRPVIAPLVEQVASLQSAQQEQAVYAEQQNLAARQAANQQAIAQASSSFAQTYAPYLSPADLLLVEDRAARSGQLGVFISQSNGDIARAHHSLLEAVVMADPEMRTRIAQAQSQAADAQTSADEQRKSLASAVSATGGAQPVKAAPKAKSAPKSKDDLNQAKADMIAAATADLSSMIHPEI